MVPMGGASGDSDPGVSGILFFGIHISFTTQAPANWPKSARLRQLVVRIRSHKAIVAGR